MAPDPSQWCPAIGQQATDTNSNTGNSIWNGDKTLRMAEHWNRDTAEPPALELFKSHLDIFLCKLLWGSYFRRRVELDDLQRSIPISTFLWFRDFPLTKSCGRFPRRDYQLGNQMSQCSNSSYSYMWEYLSTIPLFKYSSQLYRSWLARVSWTNVAMICSSTIIFKYWHSKAAIGNSFSLSVQDCCCCSLLLKRSLLTRKFL